MDHAFSTGKPAEAPGPCADCGQEVSVSNSPAALSGLQPARLRAWFANPPEWQPDAWAQDTPPAGARRCAAVLLGLVARAQPSVLMIRRPAHMRTHAGQIALPGGQWDPEDQGDPWRCALREAQEEVGLDPRQVQRLGELPIHRTHTGFDITPVVAWVQPSPSWRAHPQEVQEVFEVPLHFVLDSAHHHRHEGWIGGQQRRWWSMPYRDEGGQERLIWGATAAILRNFYLFVRAASAAMMRA
ncbi:putative Nudix hydrolase NudL [Tepidimonas alkaliphilus]|uniref:Putative Nudix hydrolase NudL n=1 Tax=Tepidimonas alkaliphilus TaxID=2588942 RepID=A0A554WD15_9BURK|nr:CoA pyrophosphatase [Tepidimonas alkaliphilus]TSE21471.1 putative Nudix hydrolase NudL [Tepidimonas alkaliphilus]